MQSYLTMMAVRLLEMHRVLKDTGSIYLHCDPTASHYLKALMDAVFGASNFRNEIVWQRAATKKGGLTRTLANDADYILWYAKSDKAQLRVEGITSPYDMGNLDEKTAKKYSSRDPQGKRFQLTSIVAPGDSEGESGQPIRFGDDVLPPPAGQHWRVPGGRQPGESMQDGFKRLWDEGRLRQTQLGRLPRYVRYLDEQPGRRLNNIWVDIPNLNSMAKERTGYPTQKPLPLLERIINTSSNPGDVVLDPFCGCATACVAAELLNRQWVGIDISPRAVDLVKQRLQQAPPLGIGDLFYKMLVIPRTDIPQRTDIDAPKNYRQNKHVLFGQQEGICAGCRMDFQYKILEVDHRISRRWGGTDHIENLQLLCPNCNRIKGDRPMEYLVSQLTATGVYSR